MAGGRSQKNKKGQSDLSPVNFSEHDSRLNFIQERMDTLLDEFGHSYGSFLAEELQKRLDHTVQMFHEDASTLLTEMAKLSSAQIEMTDEVRTGKNLDHLKASIPVSIPKQETPSDKKNDLKENGITLRVGTDRVHNTQQLFVKNKDY